MTETTPETMEIVLGKGRVVLIDTADYEKVRHRRWFAASDSRKYPRLYAKSMEFLAGGRRTIIRMHRFIMDATAGVQIDHVNGNGLDNRRANLRFCTNAQNAHNSIKRSGTLSRFKGVTFDKRRRKWGAKIIPPRPLGKPQVPLHLGSFANEEDAARAYNEAAERLFGEFALLNVLPDASAIEAFGRGK